MWIFAEIRHWHNRPETFRHRLQLLLKEVGAEEKPVPVKSSSPRLSVMAEKFIYADTVAGEFFDLLASLPATHGKGKTVLPLRMVIAQAKEQGLETVSGKTVKNHFSCMSSL